MKVLLLLLNIFLIQAVEFQNDSGFDGIDDRMAENNGMKNLTNLETQMKDMFKMNHEIMQNLRALKHMERRKMEQDNRLKRLRKWASQQNGKRIHCESRNQKLQGQIEGFRMMGGKIMEMMRLPKMNKKMN